MSFASVSPPIASPPSSSNNFMNQDYQTLSLIIILVSLLPLFYCILWCTMLTSIWDFQRRRQSLSTSDTPAVLPLRVLAQPRQQQHQQALCSIDMKGDEPNPECPICLEEAEEDAEMEAVSWQLVPECNHRFHELCLNQWLKFSRTCPLCRVTTQLEACLAVV